MSNPSITFVTIPDSDTPVLVFAGKGNVRLSGSVLYGTSELSAGTDAAEVIQASNLPAPAQPVPVNTLSSAYEFRDPGEIYAVCVKRSVQDPAWGNGTIPAQDGQRRYLPSNDTNKVVRVEAWV
jgi:hypothetical protein